MTMEKFNGWMTLIGQFAVLAGLIALVVEIRGNTLSTRTQELASITDRVQERQLALFDPDLRRAYVKALFSPEELTVDEMLGASIYMSYRINTAYRAYVSTDTGLLLEEDWQTFLTDIPLYLGSRFGRNWWSRSKNDFRDGNRGNDFVAAIDAELERSEIQPDDEYYAELCRFLGMSDCPEI